MYFIINVSASRADSSNTFIFGFINNVDGSGPMHVFVSNANNQSTAITVTSIYPSFSTIDLIVAPNSIEKVLYIG
jgi:hypothetical protein